MGLEADLDVLVGEPGVVFELAVQNTGPEEAVLEFRSGKKVDFVVFADDEEVWRWSDGRMFTQMLESETLAPDERITYTGLWENPIKGTYVVTGFLAAANHSIEATTSLIVPDDLRED